MFAKPLLAEINLTEVSFQLIDGRKLRLNDLRGRPLLVTFWATTCAPCIKEIPDLIRLYKRFATHGLEIIAVAMPYDRPDHVLTFTKENGLPYPVAIDIDAKIVHAFGNVQVTPNNFIISPNGEIIKQHIGILDASETEQLIQSVLN